LLRRYLMARKAADETFDIAGFTSAYAALGAQRATKILGIFIRLDRRDGKPGYLRHLPHLEVYLRRNLRHPSLHDLAQWFRTHLPHLFGDL
jgi:aminoglycoside/choline kinase family phosphotransferase